MTLDADVCVLGAGPAGLAAARALTTRGLDVVVVERAGRVGGLTASIEVNGQSVDLGSHRLHASTEPALLRDLQDLLGDELQWRVRHGRIRLRGRWVDFPLRPVDLVLHAEPSFVRAAASDLALAPVRARRTRERPDTFAARVRAGLGPAVATHFYEPYARKIWGVEPDQLSGELFRRRVGARTGSGIVRRAMRRSGRDGFWYPAGGFGRICDALAGAVVSEGATVLLDAQVHALELTPTGAVLELAGSPCVRARTLVSTIPTAALLGAVGTACAVPPDVIRSAAALTHRGVVLVYLVVPRAQYTAFDAHYFPGADVRIARLSEPKNYRESATDPHDRTVVCAEIPATPRNDVWEMDDASLAAMVTDELISLGLAPPAPVAVHVERRTHVYPVYRVGFEHHQEAVEAWATVQPGLVVVGRQPLFAHDNTHHALSMGAAAASCIDAHGRLDPGAWITRRATFRDHVVED